MRGNSYNRSIKALHQGPKEVSITINIIRDKQLNINDTSTPQDIQLLLFPETIMRHEPQIATKKAHLLEWLRKNWNDFSLNFTKEEAASSCAMSMSEFSKALWSLKEDGLISYFFRRSFSDYVITGIEKEASDE